MRALSEKRLQEEATNLEAQADIAKRVGISLSRFAPVIGRRVIEATSELQKSGQLAQLVEDVRSKNGAELTTDTSVKLLMHFAGLIAHNVEHTVLSNASALDREHSKLLGKAEAMKELAREVGASSDEQDEDSGPDESG
jgi:hypothetical protein